MSNRTVRKVNRVLNWYERRYEREFGPGHIGYRLYFRLFVRGR